MNADLKAIDEFLGPDPSADQGADLAAINDFLGPEINPAAMEARYGQDGAIPTGPEYDALAQTGGLGAVLSAMGHGLQHGWGTGTQYSPETVKQLQQWGIFNEIVPPQTELGKAFHDGVIRPAAGNLVGSALITGARETVQQIAEAGRGVFMGINAVTQAGLAGINATLGRDAAALAEMLVTTGHLTGGAGMAPAGGVAARLAEARDVGVIGAGEAGWRGTAPNEFSLRGGRVGADQLQPIAAEFRVPEPPPPTVHDVARQIAPETFNRYDALVADADALRAQIASRAEQLAAEQRAAAPNAAEIADLQARMADTTPRLAKKYAARLDELTAEHDAWLNDPARVEELTRNAELVDLRMQLQQLDYQLRDLAPDVTAAYRDANGRMPVEEPSPPATAEAVAAPEAPPATPIAEPAPPQPSANVEAAQGALPIEPPRPAEPAPSSPQSTPKPSIAVPPDIASDVAAKLAAAGRPAEEARAAGAVVRAYYEARAARFDGARGNAAALYAAEAPDIVGRPKGRGGAAGQFTMRDGQRVITLFDTADASTFLHESAHSWLEDLVRDAADPAAGQTTRLLMQELKTWLHADIDARTFTTRQHERFARAFEQYMREGRAPTRELAGVFQQFRDWLMQVYETIKTLGKPINNDIRRVFDRLLSSAPDARETVIAPERAADMPPAAPAGPRLTPKPIDLAGPFMRIPKEPERLTSFLVRTGGLIDSGGELKAMDAQRVRPGLMNKAGRTLDDAALAAADAGYFPELGGERPTIAEFLDRLAADMRGEPQYSAHDAQAAADFTAALEHNSEIDKLASELGIATRGPSAEEFWAEVAKKTADKPPEAEAWTAHSELVHDAATEADAYLAELGEQPDPPPPLTEAQLEAEFARDIQNDPGIPPQGGNAAELAPRPNDGARQPPADGPPGPGQGGGGQGAGGDRAAGRPATAPPAGAHAGFDPAELVDKAGNIRLDLLGTTEDINRAIRDAAIEGNDFLGARRGVVTDADVLALADDLGMSAADLNKRAIGEAFNAEQITAARRLLVQSATDVRDTMRAAAEGTDADVLAYAAAKHRHAAIQAQVAGITAEAGRALRAFRALGQDQALVDGIDALVRQETSRTLFQLRQEAKLGAQLETPAQVTKFVRDSVKPRFTDMMTEFWINALLSGPQTHMANILSNTLTAALSVVETAGAGVAGGVRRAMGGKGGVTAGEAGARLFALMQGATDGIKVAGRTFVDEGFQHRGQTVEQRTFQAIPGPVGGVVRIPSRLLAGEDEFFKAVAYRQEIAAEAHRIATAEGRTGADFNNRVADLMQNPGFAMMENAAANATYQTFTKSLGATGRALQTFANSHVLAKMLVPFIRTPTNVVKYALERSPVSLLSEEVRANLAGRNGAVAQDTQVARLAIGTAISAGVFALAAQGSITGGGPNDPAEAALWRLAGNQPYSVRIGDNWFSYRRLEPFGFLAALAADVQHLTSKIGQDDAGKLAGGFLLSIGKNVLEGVGMRFLGDTVRAIQDPDRYGGRWINQFAASFYPMGGAAGQIARTMDPYARDARTLVDQIRAKTPGLSQSLPARMDIFGQPIPSRESLGPDAVSVIYQTRVNADPVIAALQAVALFPAPVPRQIRGVDLTPEQYAEFAQISGRFMKMRLDALVNTPGFGTIPDGVRKKVLQETIEGSRETGRATMLMRHPEIIQRAIDDKLSIINTGKKAPKP